MKKCILAAVSILSLAAIEAASAAAITLVLSPAKPQVVSTAQPAGIGDGNLIRVGTFTNPADPSTFVEFGVASTALSSRMGGTANNLGNEASLDANFAGKQIYVWVYNAPTAGAATAQGVFTSANANWLFKADYAGNPASDTQAGVDPVLATTAVTFGGNPLFSGASISNPGAANMQFHLSVIPEPGTAVLALAGVLGMLVRRRR